MERRVAVVVEDDADIRGLMAELLGQSGFTVHQAGTGAAGVEAVRAHAPIVVTVDVGLPDFDGYEVTRRLRQFSDAYVVMLTARAEEIDTLLGLKAGADDYLTKPFRPRELRARIEAMLRRPRTGALPPVTGTGAAAAHPASAPLEPADGSAPALPPAAHAAGPHGATPWSAGLVHASAGRPAAPYASAARASAARSSAAHGSAASAPHPGSAAPAPHLDPAAPVPLGEAADRIRLELGELALFPLLHRVEIGGREVPLTPTEFLLLDTLLRSGQVVRSRAELARTVHGEQADAGTFVSLADERAVEVHVGNLRRKLADDPHEPRWIQTVRGVGYRTAGRPVAFG